MLERFLTREQIANFKKEGHDGLTIREIGQYVPVEFVVFDPQQIKLSDPVTYDDEGNPIPLSERFNPNNPDIRY